MEESVRAALSTNEAGLMSLLLLLMLLLLFI